MTLTTPKTLPGAEKVKDALLERRLFIRELQHMFASLPASYAREDVGQEGVN